MAGNFIRVCEPSVTKREINSVLSALKQNKISSRTDIVEGFEGEFAKKIGTKYAVAVNSGSSALFLAMWAMGIREGDEVIIPAYSFIACANSVLQCGAKPNLVDVVWNDCNINVEKISEKINRRTKAIMPVHTYGIPCEMRKIRVIAKKYNLKIIEDCSEAHGAKFDGEMVGSIGDCGCFSLYANKIITTGEGGIITTNNKELANEIRKLKDFYFIGNKGYKHKKLAWNMNLGSLNAALGLSQIERWNELIEKRKKTATYYSNNLEGCEETFTGQGMNGSVCWTYFIKTDKRDALADYLLRRGIETKMAFTPIHRQGFIKDNGRYPVAEKLEEQGLCLPTGPNISEKQAKTIIEEITLLLQSYGTIRSN